MRCVGAGAEGDADEAGKADAGRRRAFERDVRFDHSVLKVGARQQHEARVVLPFHGEADAFASEVGHRFRLHLRSAQAGRVMERKRLRRFLCEQGTGHQQR